jgi:mRNA-degrading endonuclease RelE of RelBE toxin-antitoxin system
VRILETSRFQRLRKKLADRDEVEALRAALIALQENPMAGKKLKGELAHLRSLAYAVRGQPRRLIYLFDGKDVFLFSFGPRQGIYKG